MSLLSACVHNFKRSKNNSKLGINYEGNKIIKHIKKSPLCIGYLNLQIAMDAPFFGEIADEKTRSKGRTETQIDGYDEKILINELTKAFKSIIKKANMHNSDIVIQIARGRSGIDFWGKIVKNSMKNLGDISQNLKIIFGYKSHEYFNYQNYTKKFVFINIGMFARLTPDMTVGEIYVPDKSLDVGLCNNKLNIIDHYVTNNNANILFDVYEKFPKISLAGIEDNMPFVTPAAYKEKDILDLFGCAEKINIY